MKWIVQGLRCAPLDLIFDSPLFSGATWWKKGRLEESWDSCGSVWLMFPCVYYIHIIYIYTYTCIHIYTYYIYVYIFIHIIYTYISTYIYIYIVCIYILCVCACLCIYYIYIHVYHISNRVNLVTKSSKLSWLGMVCISTEYTCLNMVWFVIGVILD
jgi:hypothetical protein